MRRFRSFAAFKYKPTPYAHLVAGPQGFDVVAAEKSPSFWFEWSMAT